MSSLVDYKTLTGCKWDYTPAVVANPGVTPARPACPSIVFTCNRI